MRRPRGMLARMKPLDLLNLLVTLDVLIQEGSVVGAARRLNLSTPAMSRSLARIREAVGDPVLVRSGAGWRPRRARWPCANKCATWSNKPRPCWAPFGQDVNLATLERVFTLRANDVFVGGFGGRLREHLRRYARAPRCASSRKASTIRARWTTTPTCTSAPCRNSAPTSRCRRCSRRTSTAWPAAGTRSSTAPSRRAVSPPMNTSACRDAAAATARSTKRWPSRA